MRPEWGNTMSRLAADGWLGTAVQALGGRAYVGSMANRILSSPHGTQSGGHERTRQFGASLGPQAQMDRKGAQLEVDRMIATPGVALGAGPSDAFRTHLIG